MGTYNPYFENNIPKQRCPVCGDERPLDWFGPELKQEVRDKHTGRVVEIRRYRKYVVCWKCRELSWMRKGVQTRKGGEDDLLIG